MSEITNTQMIKRAMTVLRPRNLAYENRAGGVASALLSAEGNPAPGIELVRSIYGVGFKLDLPER